MPRVLPVPTTAIATCPPPHTPVLRLLHAMMRQHDVILTNASDARIHQKDPDKPRHADTRHRRIYPVHHHTFGQLRDIIIPTWLHNQSAKLTYAQAATLMGALDLFETLALNRFPGTRTQQREACQRADTSFLRDITRTRIWVKNLTFEAPHGQTYSFE